MIGQRHIWELYTDSVTTDHSFIELSSAIGPSGGILISHNDKKYVYTNTVRDDIGLVTQGFGQFYTMNSVNRIDDPEEYDRLSELYGKGEEPIEHILNPGWGMRAAAADEWAIDYGPLTHLESIMRTGMEWTEIRSWEGKEVSSWRGLPTLRFPDGISYERWTTNDQ